MKVRTLAVTLSSLLSAIGIILVADHLVQTLFPGYSSFPLVPEQEQQKTCRNAVDREFVVDEKGRVCKWQSLDYITGCCPDLEPGPQETEINNCEQCKENCCAIYAYCVSCCLQPGNNFSVNSEDAKSTDKFNYCRTVCRTNSGSVINENQWKSDLKYCFPNQNPTKSTSDVPMKNIEEDRIDGEGNELLVVENFKHVNDGYLSNSLLTESKEISSMTDPKELSREDLGENGDFDLILGDIANAQKKQGDLLGKLEEKIKKMAEENQHLMEENKSLSDKLAQFKKGRLIDEKNGSRTLYTLGWGLLVLVIGCLCLGV